MTTRYVHARRGRASGTFTSPNTPARSVADAMRVAGAGDSIEIQDAATYRGGELVVDKPLTIVSTAALTDPNADPTAPGFVAGRFPELTVGTNARSRVLRVVGTPNTRTSAGPVVIKGVRITGGRAVHTASDPALGAGGGVAVIDIDNVTIERCVITGNSTKVAPVRSWPEADRLAFRTAVLDLIGEVVSPGAEGFLNTLIDSANLALKMTGRPMRLARISRAAILASIGTSFDSKLASGRPNYWLAGQAFGGGAATVWASPTFRRCLIRGNQAEGRGSGLAVVGYGWPTLDSCWIDGNRSGGAGRRDGGGIGCEVALPGRMTRDLAEIDLIRFLTGKLATVKAIIGSPLSQVTLWDLVGYAVWLTNPGRPSPAVRGVKAVILDLIGGRWETALDHLFYFFATSALSLNRWDAWDADEISRAQGAAVSISGCRLSRNRCLDDGGGLYASVLSRVRLSQCTVDGNTANSSGGGLRLSMGSAGDLNGCELLANTAVVSDPRGTLISGGGGLSARNVDLTIKNTLIGPSAAGIGIDSNVCSDHAGGGIAFQADTEGTLAGIPDLWTAIMVEVFGVRAVKLLIQSGCGIRNNGAGFDARRRALSQTSKAKGGGFWLLQGAFPDAPRVELVIEAVASTIRGNVGQTKAYVSRVQAGAVIATANEVCIQDMIGHKEWTEGTFGPLVSGGQLRFVP